MNKSATAWFIEKTLYFLRRPPTFTCVVCETRQRIGPFLFCRDCENGPRAGQIRARIVDRTSSGSGVLPSEIGEAECRLREERIIVYAKRAEEGRDVFTNEPHNYRSKGIRWWKGAKALCFCGKVVQLNLDRVTTRRHGKHTKRCPGSHEEPVMYRGRLIVPKKYDEVLV